MSYDTVKNGIVARLQSVGLAESLEIFNFTNASSNEYGNTFILKANSGSMSEETDDVNSRFDDLQEWEVQIAFAKSSQNDLVAREEAHRKREEILKDLDDPANTTFVKSLRYSSWSIDELDNYFLVKIVFMVVDRIPY